MFSEDFLEIIRKTINEFLVQMNHSFNACEHAYAPRIYKLVSSEVHNREKLNALHWRTIISK